jgi:DNA polymerase III subunit beta
MTKIEAPLKSKVLLRNIEKTYIPVLERIHVKKGIATTTNMDVWVKSPTTLDCGLYYKEGIAAGFYIKDTGLNPDDFPDFDKQKLGKRLAELTLDAHGIAALEFVSRAMSTEITRYYLCGVCFNKKHMVATDGHMLHMVNVKTKLEGNAVIPSKTVKMIAALFKETRANCASVAFYEKYMSASIGGCTITSKLIDGTYPDYMRVIPTEFEKAGRIDIAEFVRIAQKVKVIAQINGSKNPAIKISGGKISVSGDHIKTGISWDTNLDIEVGFNIRYLAQLCSGNYEYIDSQAPFLIRGDEYDGQVSILMPLRVY